MGCTIARVSAPRDIGWGWRPHIVYTHIPTMLGPEMIPGPDHIVIDDAARWVTAAIRDMGIDTERHHITGCVELVKLYNLADSTVGIRYRPRCGFMRRSGETGWLRYGQIPKDVILPDKWHALR